MAYHRWWILRKNRDEAARLASRFRGEMLDIGCVDKPYADLLRPYVTTYAGLEFMWGSWIVLVPAA